MCACVSGEVTERLKVLAWKAGVRQRTEGSNPSFSATPCEAFAINGLMVGKVENV